MHCSRRTSRSMPMFAMSNYWHIYSKHILTKIEAEPHECKSNLEFIVWPRMNLNFQHSCLPLWRARLTRICYTPGFIFQILRLNLDSMIYMYHYIFNNSIHTIKSKAISTSFASLPIHSTFLLSSQLTILALAWYLDLVFYSKYSASFIFMSLCYDIMLYYYNLTSF